MRIRNLTPKQKKVLDFITKFYEENEYSPSLEEIAHNFKRSIPTIHQQVETLKSKGFLTKEDNVSRGMQPQTQEGEIFLLGYIAAGEPIEPLENPEPVKVPISMINTPGQYYALKVKGNSMIDDGISGGDTVIIKHQITADDGDTVVAITEKGATLKILRKRNDRTFLEPRNKNLKNIYPKELEIRGKFIGLIRKVFNLS